MEEFKGKFKGIIIHWTAGRYYPNDTDYEHYHYLVNGDGLVIQGNYTPEDNLDCTDGQYARGAEGGNTGYIHVAFCGMKGFEHRDKVGLYPLKSGQCESGFSFIAGLCNQLGIPVTRKGVQTHYEFDCSRGKKGRKIDIICLPYIIIPSALVGDYIRERVIFYLNKC